MKIGILGAGQLGRMLALAGYPLGMSFRFLDQNALVCSSELSELLVGDFSDQKILTDFARNLDVVTLEFENVPASAITYLSKLVPFCPSAKALQITQDRVMEKRLFESLAVPCARFFEVNTELDLKKALASLGLPAVLKTRRLGYDGKGQYLVRDLPSALSAFSSLGKADLILEEFVNFQRELSVLAVRDRMGGQDIYPLTENLHSDSILRISKAPASNVSSELLEMAAGYAKKILSELDYVGVMAIELFQSASGLIANEIAPRVHNSGHWTMNGAVTSQFENHLRAVAGYSLGSCEAVGHSAMLNIIGSCPDVSKLLKHPDLHVHLYGKEPRPGRKLGHINIRCDTAEKRDELLEEVKARFSL